MLEMARNVNFEEMDRCEEELVAIAKSINPRYHKTKRDIETDYIAEMDRALRELKRGAPIDWEVD